MNYCVKKQRLSVKKIGLACLSASLVVSTALAGGVDLNHVYRSSRDRAVVSTGATQGYEAYEDDFYGSDTMPDVEAMRHYTLDQLEAYINELDYDSYASGLTFDEVFKNNPLAEGTARFAVEPPPAYRVPLTPIEPQPYRPNVASKLLNQLPSLESIALPTLTLQAADDSPVRAGDGNDYHVAINSQALNEQMQAWLDGATAESFQPDVKQLEVKQNVTIIRDQAAGLPEDLEGVHLEVRQVEKSELVDLLDNERDDVPEFADINTDELGLSVAVRENSNQLLLDMESAYDASRLGQYATAITYYKRVLKRDAEYMPALFGMATTYHQSEQYQQAQALYLQVLEQNPRHQGALNNVLLIIGQMAPKKALGRLIALEKANPEVALIPAQIGLLYMRAKDYRNAGLYMQRASVLDQENLTYMHYLALLVQELGKYDIAQRVIERILELHRTKNLPLPESRSILERRLEQLRLLKQQRR